MSGRTQVDETDRGSTQDFRRLTHRLGSLVKCHNPYHPFERFHSHHVCLAGILPLRPRELGKIHQRETQHVRPEGKWGPVGDERWWLEAAPSADLGGRDSVSPHTAHHITIYDTHRVSVRCVMPWIPVGIFLYQVDEPAPTILVRSACEAHRLNGRVRHLVLVEHINSRAKIPGFVVVVFRRDEHLWVWGWDFD